MERLNQQNLLKILQEWPQTILLLLLPFSYFASKAIIDINLSLLAILFLVHVICYRKWDELKRPWLLCAFAFWLYIVMRSFFTIDPAHALTHAAPWIRFPMFAAALVFFLTNNAHIHRVLAVFSGMLVFVIANMVVQYVTGHDIFGFQSVVNDGHVRLTAITHHLNIGIITAWIALPLHVFMLTKFNQSSSPLIHMVAPSLLIAGLIAVYLSGERMGFLSFVLGITLLISTLLFSGQKRNAIAIVVLFVLSAFVLSFSSSHMQNNLKRIHNIVVDVPNSAYGKLFGYGTNLFVQHPVVGVGPRHFKFYCFEGGGDTTFPCNESGRNTLNHPHNIYIELLSETGLIGLVLFLATLVLLIRERLKKPHPPLLEPLMASFLIAAFIRIWPIGSTPSFFIAWSMAPFWFWVGMVLAYKKEQKPRS